MLSPGSIGSLEQSIRYGSQDTSSLLANSLACGSLGAVGPPGSSGVSGGAAPSWVPSDFASAGGSGLGLNIGVGSSLDLNSLGGSLHGGSLHNNGSMHGGGSVHGGTALLAAAAAAAAAAANPHSMGAFGGGAVDVLRQVDAAGRTPMSVEELLRCARRARFRRGGGWAVGRDLGG
jgi:hypothetical protein